MREDNFGTEMHSSDSNSRIEGSFAANSVKIEVSNVEMSSMLSTVFSINGSRLHSRSTKETHIGMTKGNISGNAYFRAIEIKSRIILRDIR